MRLRRFGWAIRLTPMVVAIILAALWMAGAPAEIPDLRLSAPVVARPGSTIGLRAWQVDRDRDGYTVILAPDVTVELRNEADMVVTRTKLSASRAHGAEGRLAILPELHGEHSLTARAIIDGREVTVSRALHVRDGIDSRLPAGRAVNAFQVYELEPLRVFDRPRAPATLDPRVEEGACVPDLRCTLVVWVGEWQGRLRLRSRAGARFERDTARVSGGFARLPLVVVGQEGRVSVEAVGDDGVVLASREVRLPIVPGGLVARASVDDGQLRLAWESLAGRIPVLVDVFDGHRWVDARSLGPGDAWVEAPPPGVFRLQVRADLFSDNTAGVTYVAVGSEKSEAVRAAADAVLAKAAKKGLDPLAMAVLEGSFSGDAGDALRAMFAVPAFDVVAVGPGVSARIGVDEGLARDQDLRRWQAAGLILLLGFVVSMVLLRVELVAQARARQLLRDLSDDVSPPPRRPAFGRGLWAFVLLVFVLMAVLALSKRWF